MTASADGSQRRRHTIRLAGRELRIALARSASALDAEGRVAVALCIADIASFNAAIAELQWTRNKGALALYHRTVASVCRRAAAEVAGCRVETAARNTRERIDTQRSGLDERAVARLARCDRATLKAVVNEAQALRATWLDASRRAWNANRPRRAAELRTGSVYAYHVARWARAAAKAVPNPTEPARRPPRARHEALEGSDARA